MEATIKTTVKNIFKSNAFETALELTRNHRGEYIKECGVKSWNALVTHYKKANIQPETTLIAAEPETKYEETVTKKMTAERVVEKDDNKRQENISLLMKQYKEMKAKHPDAILLFRVGDFYECFNVDAVKIADLLKITLTSTKEGMLAGFPHHALDSYLPKLVRAGKRVAICEQLDDPKKISIKEMVTPSTEIPTEKEVNIQSEKENTEPVSDRAETETKVEYMLYQNDGEKVSWYGHFVNYNGLKVGESGMMVRMNNLGVGKGKVLATASMTMEEIGMFHKCYAHIRQTTTSDNRRVTLFKRAFNNLQEAMCDPKFITLSTGKAIANFVLNYKNEE